MSENLYLRTTFLILHLVKIDFFFGEENEAGCRVNYVAPGQICKSNLYKDVWIDFFSHYSENRKLKAFMTILFFQYELNYVCL